MMIRDEVKRFMHKGCLVTIALDESPENPRDYDNLGTMVFWHSSYRLGDVDGQSTYGTSADFLKWIESTRHVKLPLYLMDHSSRHIETTKELFEKCDPEGWDWGQVGWIYCSYEKALSAYGEQCMTEAVRSEVEQALRAEVAVFDHFLNGEFYGYIVERPTADGDLECVESVWGYDDLELCEQDAKCFLREDLSPENG
jgi:hypothetical protein